MFLRAEDSPVVSETLQITRTPPQPEIDFGKASTLSPYLTPPSKNMQQSIPHPPLQETTTYTMCNPQKTNPDHNSQKKKQKKERLVTYVPPKNNWIHNDWKIRKKKYLLGLLWNSAALRCAFERTWDPCDFTKTAKYEQNDRIKTFFYFQKIFKKYFYSHNIRINEEIWIEMQVKMVDLAQTLNKKVATDASNILASPGYTVEPHQICDIYLNLVFDLGEISFWQWWSGFKGRLENLRHVE